MKKREFWFVVGSQFLYGPEVLETVEARAKEMAEKLNGVPKKPQLGDRVVANVLYRDGSMLDTIREVPAR